ERGPLAARLREAGFHVVTASDSASARRALRQAAPEIVVVRLGGRLDEVAVLAAARAMRPGVSGIVLAEEIDAEKEARLLALGAQAEEAIFGGAPSALEQADQGTLFLDEIDRASPSLQARLLGAIRGRPEEGASAAPRIDVRILAATDADLDARARAGQFRSD